jgi:hypothetical protein
MSNSTAAAATLKGASMTAAKLEPRIAELFHKGLQSHRGIFVEGIVCFIQSPRCTCHELDEINAACDMCMGEVEPHGSTSISDSSHPIDCDRSEGDAEQHSLTLGYQGWHKEFLDAWLPRQESPADRFLLLEQIALFIRSANCHEISGIKKLVTKKLEGIRVVEERLMAGPGLPTFRELLEDRPITGTRNGTGDTHVRLVQNMPAAVTPVVKISSTRVGKNIDTLRKECGWSFDKLAGETGIDKKSILAHVNKGTRPRPRILKEYAQAFSKALGRNITAPDLEK